MSTEIMYNAFFKFHIYHYMKYLRAQMQNDEQSPQTIIYEYNDIITTVAPLLEIITMYNDNHS